MVVLSPPSVSVNELVEEPVLAIAAMSEPVEAVTAISNLQPSTVRLSLSFCIRIPQESAVPGCVMVNPLKVT